MCSLVSHLGYYCLSAWEIFASVGIVVATLAIDCDVGTFNLATIFLEVIEIFINILTPVTRLPSLSKEFHALVAGL